MAILADFTPLLEPVSIDEAFLDVTGTEGLHGDGPAVARTIKARIAASLRLTASVGVAANKFVAKVASDLRKPDGLVVVAAGHRGGLPGAAAGLAPLGRGPRDRGRARGHGPADDRPARRGPRRVPRGPVRPGRPRAPGPGPRARRPRGRAVRAAQVHGRRGDVRPRSSRRRAPARHPARAGRARGARAARGRLRGALRHPQAPLRRLLHADAPPHRRSHPGRARDLPPRPRPARPHSAPPAGAAHRAVRVRRWGRPRPASSRCSSRTRSAGSGSRGPWTASPRASARSRCARPAWSGPAPVVRPGGPLPSA